MKKKDLDFTTKNKEINLIINSIMKEINSKSNSEQNEIPKEHKLLLENELGFEEKSIEPNFQEHEQKLYDKHGTDFNTLLDNLRRYEDLYSLATINKDRINRSNKILKTIRRKLHTEIIDWLLLPLVVKQTHFNVESIKSIELAFEILHKLDTEKNITKSEINELRSTYDATKSEINELRSTYDATKSEINELRSTYDATKSEINDLGSWLENIQSKIEKTELEEKIKLYFKAYLEKTPPQAELDWYVNAIRKEQMRLVDVPNHLKQLEEYDGVKRWKHGCVYTIFGTKMYLNKNDRDHSRILGYLNYWELEESKFLKSFVKEGMQILDIGANIGYYTLLFSKWAGQNGKVFSFEPSPENFALLLTNLQANQCKNVFPYQNAVTNHTDSEYLYLSQTNPGDHRICDFYAYEHDDHRDKIKVETKSLDSFFNSDQKIDLIKMDIEGAEGLALQGMTNLINKNKKLLLFTEFWPYAIEQSGFTPKEFIEQILQLGFKIFILSNGKKQQISSQFKLIEEYSISDQVNLFCEK